MMFSELCERFIAHTGAVGQVDNAQLALWFNEAQRDLAYDLHCAPPSDFSGTNGNQISELPKPVHYLLAMFAASRYWDMKDDGRLAANWMHRYYQDKSIICEWPFDGCVNHDKWEESPLTNADHIRAMTDEELAEWFASMPCCPPSKGKCSGLHSTRKCSLCWLNWLKQEVTDEREL